MIYARTRDPVERDFAMHVIKEAVEARKALENDFIYRLWGGDSDGG